MGKRKKQKASQPVRREAIPPDQDRRDAIVTRLDTTMLVEASAGAGKTRSMVDRMIALVCEGKCRIDTLAAITFTRKAAAELRARFQVALEKACRQSDGMEHDRLTRAVDHVERVFIGTIHSFCGRLLRERPVEAGIEPSFQELEETTDARLRSDAWNQHVAELIATGNPILGELVDLGLQVGDLETAFLNYATYPDVDEWPSEEVQLPNLEPARDALRTYITHIKGLLPSLPDDSKRDKLMPALRRVARLCRQANLTRPAELMEVLAEFGEPGKMTVVQKMWPGKKTQALAEKDRWEAFTANTAAPLVSLWRQLRYPVILRVLHGAVSAYDRLREEAGGLNYQDLLLLAARLLRDKAQIRPYFRRRFTHLLVDEFQDTDPVQAEVMILLTADNPNETDWRRAKPVAGALFVVGDPKQSIYRFRRADIVTYNEVKKIIEQNGQVITLSANFRSVELVIDWVNRTFDQVFPSTADAHSPARSPMDFVHGGDEQGHSGGVEVLRIPAAFGKIDDVVTYETEAVARIIKTALKGKKGTPAVKPGDFLIIAARKRHLSRYAAQLSQLDIPCEVTGGAVLNEIRELELLCLCLEALTEPDNSVSLVAVLRSELFGMPDDALYAFKRAGGRFAFHASIPEELASKIVDLLKYAFERLKQYASWLRRLPPVAAIERIVTDLGLSAHAAAGAGGNVRAGSIARAIELIRSAQATFPSIGEIVAYLRQLADGEETHDGLPAA
ncbi:MAG: UvrD-helicase domain-containing protein, partial [Pirellulaceae bacterium]